MKIALSIILAFFALGCSDSSKEEVIEAKSVEAPKVEVEKSAIVKIKENVIEATESTKASVSEAVDSMKENPSVIKAVDSMKEKTTEAVSRVKDSVSSIADTVVAKTIDGKALYATCISCHGVNGEKKALGKSAVIQGWDSAKTESALNGYKDGSYGGAMKAVMKGQATKFNAAQTKAIADYIAGL